jgi:hypothetical protein
VPSIELDPKRQQVVLAQVLLMEADAEDYDQRARALRVRADVLRRSWDLGSVTSLTDKPEQP